MSFVVRWLHAQLVDEAKRLVDRCTRGAPSRSTDLAPLVPSDLRWAEGVVSDLEHVDLTTYPDPAAFLTQAEIFARNRPSQPEMAEPTRARDEFVQVVLGLRKRVVRDPSPLEALGMDRSRLVLASCVQLTLHKVVERDDWRRTANEPPSEFITLVGANLWHQHGGAANRIDLPVTDADVVLTLARAAAGMRHPPGRTTAVERPVTQLRLYVEDGLDGNVVASTMGVNHYASITPVKEPWHSFLSIVVAALEPESEAWAILRKRLASRPPEGQARTSNVG